MEIVRHFNFGEFNIEVIKNGEDIWFKEKDVALALGYKKTENAIKRHVDDEDKKECRLITPRNGVLIGKRGRPTFTAINEPGLYSLLFRSELEFARRFKKWIFSLKCSRV